MSFYKNNKFIILVLSISFLLRILFSMDNVKMLFSDISAYDNFASNIIEHGNMYNSAYQAPGYTYFIALIYKLLGHSLFNVYIMQAVLGTGSTLLIYLIAKNIFNEKIGKLSSGLSLLYWPLTLYSGILLAEILFIFLLLSGVFMFLKALDTDKLKYFSLSAVFFSLATLTRSITLFFLFVIPVLYLIYKFSYMLKKISLLKDIFNYTDNGKALVAFKISIVMRNIIIFVCIFCMMLTPWVVRNYLKYNAFIPVDTLGGINLYIGNNDKSNGTFVSIVDDPEYNTGKNDYETDKRLKSLAVKYIINHPLKFTGLTVVRGVLFASMDLYSFDWVLIKYMENNFLFNYCTIFWIIFMALCCLSFFVLGIFGIKNLLQNFKGANLLVFVLYFFSLTSVFYVQYRYRLPVMPFMAISAAFGYEHFKKYSQKLIYKFSKSNKKLPSMDV